MSEFLPVPELKDAFFKIIDEFGGTLVRRIAYTREYGLQFQKNQQYFEDGGTLLGGGGYYQIKDGIESIKITSEDEIFAGDKFYDEIEPEDETIKSRIISLMQTVHIPDGYKEELKDAITSAFGEEPLLQKSILSNVLIENMFEMDVLYDVVTGKKSLAPNKAFRYLFAEQVRNFDYDGEKAEVYEARKGLLDVVDTFNREAASSKTTILVDELRFLISDAAEDINVDVVEFYEELRAEFEAKLINPQYNNPDLQALLESLIDKADYTQDLPERIQVRGNGFSRGEVKDGHIIENPRDVKLTCTADTFKPSAPGTEFMITCAENFFEMALRGVESVENTELCLLHFWSALHWLKCPPPREIVAGDIFASATMLPTVPHASHDPFATPNFTGRYKSAVSQYLQPGPLDWSITYKVDPAVTGPVGIHDVSIKQLIDFLTHLGENLFLPTGFHLAANVFFSFLSRIPFEVSKIQTGVLHAKQDIPTSMRVPRLVVVEGTNSVAIPNRIVNAQFNFSSTDMFAEDGFLRPAIREFKRPRVGFATIDEFDEEIRIRTALAKYDVSVTFNLFKCVRFNRGDIVTVNDGRYEVETINSTKIVEVAGESIIVQQEMTLIDDKPPGVKIEQCSKDFKDKLVHSVFGYKPITLFAPNDNDKPTLLDLGVTVDPDEHRITQFEPWCLAKDYLKKGMQFVRCESLLRPKSQRDINHNTLHTYFVDVVLTRHPLLQSFGIELSEGKPYTITNDILDRGVNLKGNVVQSINNTNIEKMELDDVLALITASNQIGLTFSKIPLTLHRVSFDVSQINDDGVNDEFVIQSGEWEGKTITHVWLEGVEERYDIEDFGGTWADLADAGHAQVQVKLKDLPFGIHLSDTESGLQIDEGVFAGYIITSVNGTDLSGITDDKLAVLSAEEDEKREAALTLTFPEEKKLRLTTIVFEEQTEHEGFVLPPLQGHAYRSNEITVSINMRYHAPFKVGELIIINGVLRNVKVIGVETSLSDNCLFSCEQKLVCTSESDDELDFSSTEPVLVLIERISNPRKFQDVVKELPKCKFSLDDDGGDAEEIDRPTDTGVGTFLTKLRTWAKSPDTDIKGIKDDVAGALVKLNIVVSKKEILDITVEKLLKKINSFSSDVDDLEHLEKVVDQCIVETLIAKLTDKTIRTDKVYIRHIKLYINVSVREKLIEQYSEAVLKFKGELTIGEIESIIRDINADEDFKEVVSARNGSLEDFQHRVQMYVNEHNAGVTDELVKTFVKVLQKDINQLFDTSETEPSIRKLRELLKYSVEKVDYDLLACDEAELNYVYTFLDPGDERGQLQTILKLKESAMQFPSAKYDKEVSIVTLNHQNDTLKQSAVSTTKAKVKAALVERGDTQGTLYITFERSEREKRGKWPIADPPLQSPPVIDGKAVDLSGSKLELVKGVVDEISRSECIVDSDELVTCLVNCRETPSIVTAVTCARGINLFRANINRDASDRTGGVVKHNVDNVVLARKDMELNCYTEAGNYCGSAVIKNIYDEGDRVYITINSVLPETCTFVQEASPWFIFNIDEILQSTLAPVEHGRSGFVVNRDVSMPQEFKSMMHVPRKLQDMITNSKVHGLPNLSMTIAEGEGYEIKTMKLTLKFNLKDPFPHVVPRFNTLSCLAYHSPKVSLNFTSYPPLHKEMYVAELADKLIVEVPGGQLKPDSVQFVSGRLFLKENAAKKFKARKAAKKVKARKVDKKVNARNVDKWNYEVIKINDHDILPLRQEDVLGIIRSLYENETQMTLTLSAFFLCNSAEPMSKKKCNVHSACDAKAFDESSGVVNATGQDGDGYICSEYGHRYKFESKFLGIPEGSLLTGIQYNGKFITYEDMIALMRAKPSEKFDFTFMYTETSEHVVNIKQGRKITTEDASNMFLESQRIRALSVKEFSIPSKYANANNILGAYSTTTGQKYYKGPPLKIGDLGWVFYGAKVRKSNNVWTVFPQAYVPFGAGQEHVTPWVHGSAVVSADKTYREYISTHCIFSNKLTLKYVQAQKRPFFARPANDFRSKAFVKVLRAKDATNVIVRTQWGHEHIRRINSLVPLSTYTDNDEFKFRRKNVLFGNQISDCVFNFKIKGQLKASNVVFEYYSDREGTSYADFNTIRNEFPNLSRPAILKKVQERKKEMDAGETPPVKYNCKYGVSVYLKSMICDLFRSIEHRVHLDDPTSDSEPSLYFCEVIDLLGPKYLKYYESSRISEYDSNAMCLAKEHRRLLHCTAVKWCLQSLRKEGILSVSEDKFSFVSTYKIKDTQFEHGGQIFTCYKDSKLDKESSSLCTYGGVSRELPSDMVVGKTASGESVYYCGLEIRQRLEADRDAKQAGATDVPSYRHHVLGKFYVVKDGVAHTYIESGDDVLFDDFTTQALDKTPVVAGQISNLCIFGTFTTDPKESDTVMRPIRLQLNDGTKFDEMAEINRKKGLGRIMNPPTLQWGLGVLAKICLEHARYFVHVDIACINGESYHISSASIHISLLSIVRRVPALNTLDFDQYDICFDASDDDGEKKYAKLLSSKTLVDYSLVTDLIKLVVCNRDDDRSEYTPVVLSHETALKGQDKVDFLKKNWEQKLSEADDHYLTRLKDLAKDGGLRYKVPKAKLIKQLERQYYHKLKKVAKDNKIDPKLENDKLLQEFEKKDSIVVGRLVGEAQLRNILLKRSKDEVGPNNDLLINVVRLSKTLNGSELIAKSLRPSDFYFGFLHILHLASAVTYSRYWEPKQPYHYDPNCFYSVNRYHQDKGGNYTARTTGDDYNNATRLFVLVARHVPRGGVTLYPSTTGTVFECAIILGFEFLHQSLQIPWRRYMAPKQTALGNAQLTKVYKSDADGYALARQDLLGAIKGAKQLAEVKKLPAVFIAPNKTYIPLNDAARPLRLCIVRPP